MKMVNLKFKACILAIVLFASLFSCGVSHSQQEGKEDESLFVAQRLLMTVFMMSLCLFWNVFRGITLFPTNLPK